MRTTIPVLISCIVILAGCTPRITNDFIEAEEYDRTIRKYPDLVENKMIYSVQVGLRSDEKLAFGSRFTLKMDLIKNDNAAQSEYPVRFVLRSSPEEWPVEEVAYLFIDDRKIELNLTQIDPRKTVRISGSAMDGDVSISTSEVQVLRLESNIPQSAITSIKPSSKVVFVFRSGDYPVTFQLADFDVTKMISLREGGVS